MHYPKINSLWRRAEDAKRLIKGDYACDALPNIREWDVTEKVDGTNIRITFLQADGQRTQPSIEGRTDAAIIPSFLLDSLKPFASWDLFDKAFHLDGPNFEVTLFGEGYGEKIQTGGGDYREGTGLILFDVVINGRWMDRRWLLEVASVFGLPVVPYLGRMRESAVVGLVKSRPESQCSRNPRAIEGVVAKASYGICDSHGVPIMFKLKCRDFSDEETDQQRLWESTMKQNWEMLVKFWQAEPPIGDLHLAKKEQPKDKQNG